MQNRKQNAPFGLRKLRTTTLFLNKVVGSESEKGYKEKGCGDEQRREERKKPKKIRGEENEVRKVQRVRKYGETKMEEDGEEITRELILLNGSV